MEVTMQHAATNQTLRLWEPETEPAQAMWCGLRAEFAAAMTRVFTHFRVLNAQRRLLAMDDYMLKDIGIARSEIEHAVRAGRPTATRQGR
jgi:uncharacterized protein YjiS (DUF1127 family)